MIERESGEMLGLVEAERAFTTIHPGAIYLHLGRSYEVERLDVEERRAIVSAFDGDWYTRPKKETEIYIERTHEQRQVAGVQLNFGEVSVTEQVIAFQRVSISDQEPIDIVALELPEQSFVTQALWYVLPERLSGALPSDVLLGSLHATEHGQIAVLPLIAMCDRWDIGGLSTNVHFQTGRSTIFIYDGHPGGVGITQRGYEQFERLLGDAERLIAECPCESGCPSCVQSPKCGNLNEPLHKAGALELMGLMRGRSASWRPRLELQRSSRMAVKSDTAQVQGQSSRRARIAKAWDQASGVVERGDAACGRRPAREALPPGSRRGAGRRAGAAPASRRRARRGSRRSTRSARSTGSAPGQSSPGRDAEAGLARAQVEQGPADRREERRLRKRPHRPGRRGVEPRARVAGLSHQAARDLERRRNPGRSPPTGRFPSI